MKKTKTMCFGWNPTFDRCDALNVKRCTPNECVFFKTKTQAEADREKAKERLISIGCEHLVNYIEYRRCIEKE